MQNIQSAEFQWYDTQLQFCLNIAKRSQGKQGGNVEVELEKDSTVYVRENYYKMIGSSYSNTQLSFEGFCCLQRQQSRGVLHIACQQYNRIL